MPLLIDGHNLIAALPDIDLEDPNDEMKLLLKLRSWAGHHRRKITLVFDGGIPGGYSRTLSSSNISVIFAAQHYSIADRIIMERLRYLRDANNWTVVSSDMEVLDAARQAGARVLTSQAFAQQLTQGEAPHEKPSRVSDAEVQAWLEIFGEAEEAEPSPPSAPAKPGPAATRKKPAPPRKKKTQPPQASPQQQRRTTRTIAEQLGQPSPAAPEKRTRTRGEKPDAVSNEEVAAWLEVFHDEPEHPLPPPKKRRAEKKPAQQPGQRQPLVVDKEGQEGKEDNENLSAEDVEAWLDIFPELPEAPQGPQQSPKRKGQPVKRSSRLQKEREKYHQQDDTGKTDGLSEEELARWYRIYGIDPDET